MLTLDGVKAKVVVVVVVVVVVAVERVKCNASDTTCWQETSPA